MHFLLSLCGTQAVHAMYFLLLFVDCVRIIYDNASPGSGTPNWVLSGCCDLVLSVWWHTKCSNFETGSGFGFAQEEFAK